MTLSVEQVLAINAMSGAKKAALMSMVTGQSEDVSSFKGFFAFVKKIKPACTEDELKKLLQIAEKQVLASKQNNIHIISVLDESYPVMLNSTPNQPLVLFAKGNLSLLNANLSIAIVGTREASEYAVETAQSFAKSMADEGVCIVSGLALGCDTAAHKGALATSTSIIGNTIAVMAHGLDSVYPPENRALAEKIIENGGCLVSEHAPGVGIQRAFFVARNRIQSGLSVATVVIQSGVSGGTMTTARHCLAQKRLLICMAPPSTNIDNADYAGNEQLIAKGAKVVRNIEDIKLLVNNNTPSTSALIPDNQRTILFHSSCAKRRKSNDSRLQESIIKYMKPNLFLQTQTPNKSISSIPISTTASNTSSQDSSLRVLTSSLIINQPFNPPRSIQTPAFNNAIGAASSNTQLNADNSIISTQRRARAPKRKR